jgi:hypothetical protein
MSHPKKKADRASEMWNFLASDDGQCPQSQSRYYGMTFLTEIERNVARAAFNKKTLFTNKLDLNLRKKLLKCYFEHRLIWC